MQLLLQLDLSMAKNRETGYICRDIPERI